MGLVLAQGDCHQRVATVIEYWPVREGAGGSGDSRLLDAWLELRFYRNAPDDITWAYMQKSLML